MSTNELTVLSAVFSAIANDSCTGVRDAFQLGPALQWRTKLFAFAVQHRSFRVLGVWPTNVDGDQWISSFLHSAEREDNHMLRCLSQMDNNNDDALDLARVTLEILAMSRDKRARWNYSALRKALRKQRLWTYAENVQRSLQ